MAIMQAISPRWFHSLVWLVFENHGYSEVANLPSHLRLAESGSVSTKYHATTHPSGPNYRSLAAGEFWSSNEFIDEKHDSIADVLKGIGIDTLMVNVRGQCAQRHSPFLDLHSTMTQTSQDGIDPDADEWKSPGHIYLGFDDSNNAHSADISIADKNLSDVLDALDKSKWFNTPIDGLYPALFFVWDEVYTDTINQVFASWYGRGVRKGFTDTVFRNHYSFTRTVTDNWGLTALNHAQGLQPMIEVFTGVSK